MPQRSHHETLLTFSTKQYRRHAACGFLCEVVVSKKPYNRMYSKFKKVVRAFPFGLTKSDTISHAYAWPGKCSAETFIKKSALSLFALSTLHSTSVQPYFVTTDESNTHVNTIHMPLTNLVLFYSLFCGTFVVQFFAKVLFLSLSFYSMWFVCRRACTLQV